MPLSPVISPPSARRRTTAICLAAASMLLLMSAASARAASNYRPIDRHPPRTPWRSEPAFDRQESDDGFLAGGLSRGRWPASTRDDDLGELDRDRPAPRFERNPGGFGRSPGRYQEGDDLFGIVGSSGFDALPRRRPAKEEFEIDRSPPRPMPQPNSRPTRSAPPRPAAPRSPSEAEEPSDPTELIGRRYQDSAVRQFLGSISPQQAVSMYAETLELIQARHLSPPSPQAMVERGMTNLMAALQTPAFVQANRLSIDPRQAQALSMEVSQRPIQDVNDAVAALQSAMQGAASMGLAPQAVALEFEYGAIESLDRFSAFVPAETARRFNQQLGEAVVGVGVQIEAADQGLRVLKVLPGGPAAERGLQTGDVIVAVDGQPLAGRDLESASGLISGPAGSQVTLSIVRERGPVAEVALGRRSIELHSVTDVQLLDPAVGVGYMKLETFASNSADEMEQALWSLHQQGMQSLILDLRGDPGGLLTAAIDVAMLFIPEGTIVSTRGRTDADNSTQTAGREQVWKVPLVVLVDENSASASEILAAAIQENGRGTIVGRHTYGKGTVQTLLELQSVSAGLRLTTAKFYSPTGREMAGAGVEPDVPVSVGRSSGQVDLTSDRDVQAALEVAGGQIQPRLSRQNSRSMSRGR